MPDLMTFIARCVLFAAVHSALAIPGLKRRLAGNGSPEPRWYRLTYNLLSVFLFAWVMSAWRSSRVLYFAPGSASLVMYVLQAILAAALISCVKQTGAGYFLGIKQLKESGVTQTELVTNGWYAVCRHPLYLLSLLFMGLTPVMTAQWLVLTVFSAVYFAAGSLLEEKRLLKEFGDEYRNYQRQVPFLFPRNRLVRRPSP